MEVICSPSDLPVGAVLTPVDEPCENAAWTRPYPLVYAINKTLPQLL
jgi:hypothetical protein